ncbi:unnamed protein product [Moneuplotes crassus]|uniref:Uncharacterized protein n=1 Tax=Euplotes crassus TaxID=5936 RepID=A0AAD2D5S1_EUPCR|nr:unnamed protein product [Moneuplotes crassus]
MTEPGDQKTIAEAKLLAREYAKHNSDDQGNLYAKIWEVPEFREAFDYNMGYEKKNMLKYRAEAVFRHTRLSKQLFQKVYYNPNLLLDDETNMRKHYVTESGSHDLRSTFINWLVVGTYFPALYAASTRFRGWGCFFAVTAGWYFLYTQGHQLNNNILQKNLNSFASPLVEKYGIIDHHDN